MRRMEEEHLIPSSGIEEGGIHVAACEKGKGELRKWEVGLAEWRKYR